MNKTRLVLVMATLGALTACAGSTPPPRAATASAPSAPDEIAASTISAALLLDHIKVLASDDYEGRLPGTAGEAKTIAYLSEQFRALGLQPGNPDGSWLQDVPLVGITGTPTMQLRAGGHDIAMQARTDFVATSAHLRDEVQVRDAPLLFVGYGVQAPEYGWDDYKGVDVRGKTLVMLINDPAVPDPQHPGQLDPGLFKGKAMTYYGRWTYKYEIASRLGAAAAIIVHETIPAAYPWEVVRNSWSGEQFTLDAADQNRGTVPVKAWITVDKARELFRDAGLDYATLKQQALSRDFKPVALKASASFDIHNRIRHVASHNVVARLPGSDPALAGQTVIYSAHWDHFGRNPALSGDQIFNGAADNASGTAGLLALARAYRALPVAPKRSVLFLAVTAEEQGLLGSAYYATHPLYPLASTVADINMDNLNTWGVTRDLQVIGSGQNTLEDTLSAEAARQGRVITADNETEKGYYYRSDQFEFAKVGVPGLYTKAGIDYLGKPAGYGAQKRADYIRNDYHKPSDEIKADWDLSGAAADLRLLFAVGLDVANDAQMPQWQDGSEFKAIREHALHAQ